MDLQSEGALLRPPCAQRLGRHVAATRGSAWPPLAPPSLSEPVMDAAAAARCRGRAAPVRLARTAKSAFLRMTLRPGHSSCVLGGAQLPAHMRLCREARPPS